MDGRRTQGGAPTRRGFVVGGLAGVGAAAFASCAEELQPVRRAPLVAPGDVVLFQGDSITDGGRVRDGAGAANDLAEFGRGYAWLAAVGMLVARPDDGLRCYNRGVGGDRVRHLDERFERDCFALAPDVLSVLIGVNDLWHARNSASTATAADYEREYRALIDRTRAALPDVALVVCEPFVLRCGHVTDDWFPAFDDYRAAARRIADDHARAFVPFHAVFERASALAPPEFWAKDGIHPTAAGAALMAQAWLRVVDGGRA